MAINKDIIIEEAIEACVNMLVVNGHIGPELTSDQAREFAHEVCEPCIEAQNELPNDIRVILRVTHTAAVHAYQIIVGL